MLSRIPSILRRLRWTTVVLVGWLLFVGAWELGSSGMFRNWISLGDGNDNVGIPRFFKDTPKELTGGPDYDEKKPEKLELEEPPASVVLSNSSDRNQNINSGWRRRDQTSWKLMILFQHNLPILQQAVDGYRRASSIMAPNIVVIDNSETQEAFKDVRIRNSVNEVIVTPSTLNFPQLHNYMTDTAMEKDLEFFFWAHADNYVLPLEAGRDLGMDVLECMEQQVAKEANWGMLLFSYDHLAAFRTQTMVQVPWDPLIFQYGSECDVYGRIRDAGYEAKACKVHLSYDMKRVMNITDGMSWQETKDKLDADAKDKAGRNQWRENAMSDNEQEWRKAMKLASREYLVNKWKQRGCKVRGLKCYRPWPYCPKCPDHIPDCFPKRPTKTQLRHIYTESRKVFQNDEVQPIPFQVYQKLHSV
eukprot:m.47171 g.47171  ORF g.47171 m.47171 type:complete len:417 (-) comp20436_c0_seq1:61-1311(-)